MAINAVQTNTLYLAGSGVIIGATSVVLTSFSDIYGNALALADFGTKGYITLEPDTTNEESATFTSVTVNANGTVTLGGISTALAKSPYTETSGLVRQHSGGTKVVVTDTASFWNTFGNKNNQNTWVDIQTFTAIPVSATNPVNANQVANKAYIDGVAIAGAPNASSTVKGITKLTLDPVAPTNPLAVGDNDTRVPPVNTSTMTANQVAALAGLGAPSATSLFLTEANLAGIISPYAGRTAPTGWLLCDATAVSRATYSRLFAVINPTIGVVTISNASPAVITLTAHGLAIGDAIYFTTTGGLPTGLTINTLYYIITAGFGVNSFQVSATRGGTAINTSSAGSGTHTMVFCPYGLGDGTTTFNTPDLRGKIAIGRDSTADFLSMGLTGGEKTHVLITAEMPSHTHSLTTPSGSSGANGSLSRANDAGGGSTPVPTVVVSSAGSDGAHNNIQPYVTTIYIIKT